MDLLISSRNRSLAVNISESVLTKMSITLPSRFIDTRQWETVKELELAHTDFNKPTSIDLLIGTFHYEKIMIGNNRKKDHNCGIIYRLSMFGWVVVGRKHTEKTIQTICRLSLFPQRQTNCCVFGKQKKFQQRNFGQPKKNATLITSKKQLEEALKVGS